MKRLAFLLIVLALILTACIPGLVDRSPSQGSEPSPTLQPVEKVLSSFNPIQGTDYLMAGIVAIPGTRESSLNPLEWINSSGYSSYSSNTYNYIFFDLETEQYHRLLSSNEYAIYQTSGFPTLQYDPANPNQPAPTVEWWVYSVIKKDTDGNGYLGYGDDLTIGISDVGGNGYTELIEGVNAILSQIYKNNSALFIIYSADKKNYIAKINLSTREVVSTTEMDLGEDVK
jgi:hypothetical protein